MQATQALAGFLADLQYAHIPGHVLERTEDLFLDWLGSALATQGGHPIPTSPRWSTALPHTW